MEVEKKEGKKYTEKNFSLQCVPLKKKISKKRRDGWMDIQWMFHNCNPTFFFLYISSLLPPHPGRRKKVVIGMLFSHSKYYFLG